jgi:hypothetical protein
MSTHKRTLVALEFLSLEGYKFELKEDGWWILKPRTYGEKALDAARELLEKIEACAPPEILGRDGKPIPPTMLQIGEHVAKTFNLRINHHRFKQK